MVLGLYIVHNILKKQMLHFRIWTHRWNKIDLYVKGWSIYDITIIGAGASSLMLIQSW